LDQIPLPKLEGSTDDYDYCLEDLVFSGRDIIPEMVDVHVRSDLEFDVTKMETEKASTNVVLNIRDIKPKVQDIRFWIHKKSFPRLEDRGTANIAVKGDGMSIKVMLDIRVSENIPYIKASRVSVDIDRLDVDIIECEHEILMTLFSPIYKNRIKHIVKDTIEQKVQSAFDRIETGFNDLMVKYPPKITGVLKEQIQQVTAKIM